MIENVVWQPRSTNQPRHDFPTALNQPQQHFGQQDQGPASLWGKRKQEESGTSTRPPSLSPWPDHRRVLWLGKVCRSTSACLQTEDQRGGKRPFFRLVTHVQPFELDVPVSRRYPVSDGTMPLQSAVICSAELLTASPTHALLTCADHRG